MAASELFPSIASFLTNRDNFSVLSEDQKNALLIDSEKFPPELLSIAEELEQLTRTWNPVEFVTATAESREAEKAKVIAAYREGNEYNPRFQYEGVDSIQMDLTETERRIKGLLARVRAFRPTNEFERIARVALRYKVLDDLASVKLILGIKHEDETLIKSALNVKYSPLDTEIVTAAQQAYEAAIAETAHPTKLETTPLLTQEQQKLLKNSQVNAEEIKAAFEWILDQYGILRSDNNSDGFAVVIDSTATSIDVRDKSATPMTIFIPANRVMTAEKLLEMCGHEIESHARQSMNGGKMVLGGGLLKVDEEVLYEGLARNTDGKFHERYFGEKDTSPVMLYVLAIALAEQGASFAEIFKDQVDKHLHILLGINAKETIDYSSPVTNKKLAEAMEEAWKKTYRVMRGHTDTSNPQSYAFAKDAAYFRGIMLHQQLETMQFGYINDAAIMQTHALALLGRLNLTEEHIPYPYQDYTNQYCFDVLIPMLEQRATQSAS